MDKKRTFSIVTDNHLHIILGNMCRYVEGNYWKIDFSSNQWFQEYTWDNEKEEHFKKWLTDYFYSMRAAQKEFYGRTNMKKKECENAAAEFVFNYGWSLSKQKEIMVD